jgi:hypothetical protein
MKRQEDAMKTLMIAAFPLAATLLAAHPAAAQKVEVRVSLPVVRFEVEPPLVVVAPGVRVVPDYDEEVFFVDGFWWTRMGTYWYRSHDYRGGWVVVPRGVPVVLVKMPPGHYKHFKPGKAKAVGVIKWKKGHGKH